MKQWLFYAAHMTWIMGCALCVLYDYGWMTFDSLLPMLITSSIVGATALNLKRTVPKTAFRT